MNRIPSRRFPWVHSESLAEVDQHIMKQWENSVITDSDVCMILRKRYHMRKDFTDKQILENVEWLGYRRL